MIFKSEEDLTSFAENFGLSLKSEQLPLCLELVGDVGAGKTTFTRALARGLGITEPVTSPSFTISKKYYWSAYQNCDTLPSSTPVEKNELIHYDFYRLSEPGLMLDDLNESLNNPRAIVVLEWANTVQNILPKNHQTITFKVLENGNRELCFASGKTVSSRDLIPSPKTEETYVHDAPTGLRQTPKETSDRERTNRTATASEPLSLYLDTSDFTAKIKLENGSGESWEYSDSLGREMAEKLLKTLKTHLEEHGKSFKDLKKITFMSGPGSFTGLRIGACIVNTLSHELDIPLYDHKGARHKIILPDYGRPANITPPKK